MAVYTDIRELNFDRTVVTAGSFDGVHCGHRMLLRHVADVAKRHCLRSVALTFWPHPQRVLASPEEAPLLLGTLDERVALLAQSGIDDVVVFPFNTVFSQTPANDFVSEIIIGKLKAKYFVAGQDHHFGKDRSGNVQQLSEIVAKSNLQIEVVDLEMCDRKISSSAIRNALLCGDLNSANEMLGYPYIISGKVIKGNQLGRTIGFPTANIKTPACKLLPKEGVYHVNVKIGEVGKIGEMKNQKLTGMMFIGKRSVLKQEDIKPQIEVHLFHFDQQIYGQEIVLSLTHRIRNNLKFENITQLTEQLHRDRKKIMDMDA